MGRSVKLTGRAVEALKRHEVAQNKERLRFLGRSGRITASSSRPDGQSHAAWSPIGGPYLRLLKRAGLPKNSPFHDLRHTCATLLLKRSIHPKIVQELLGHASISITLLPRHSCSDR